jgi:hypothetical protein
MIASGHGNETFFQYSNEFNMRGGRPWGGLKNLDNSLKSLGPLDVDNYCLPLQKKTQ